MDKLTVGMATFDDFDGTVFTVKDLHLHHSGDVGKVIIIDNNPDSQHGHMVREFIHNAFGDNGWAEYVAFPTPKGTAVPRNMVFERAPAGIVVCTDSHVLFYPGALSALRAFYDDHPDFNGLVQGPIMYNNGYTYSTHFDLRYWGAEMWGQWAGGWVNYRDNKAYQMRGYPGNKIGLEDILTYEPLDLPGGPYDQAHFEDALRSLGYFPATEVGRVFDIPAQGLGTFACRKSDWLGFNPAFRGFGGEEGYIHIKYRQQGRRTVCLSHFKWWHRFGRVNGITYPINRFHKVRNYILGYGELGLDLEPVYNHFVRGVGLEPGHKPMTIQEWDHVYSGGFNPEQETTAPKPQACCNQVLTIEQWYQWARATPSLVNEHVDTLKAYAQRSPIVVEFAGETIAGTVGLLAGKPPLMITYSLSDTPQIHEVAKQAAQEHYETRYEFYIADSRAVEIPDCDLLYIDSRHTAQHRYEELEKHWKNVRKYIILHDTEIFGENGEDNQPGIRHAIRSFVLQHPEWHTIRHDANNRGLTILSRLEEDKPPALPSKWRMAKNLFKSTWKDVMNGLARVPLEVAEERYAICTSNGGTCPLGQRRIDDDRCAGCGCFLQQTIGNVLGKVHRPLDACPFGLWGNYRPDEVEGIPDEARSVVLHQPQEQE